MTATSSGTLRPHSTSARMAPMAIGSVAQNTASKSLRSPSTRSMVSYPACRFHAHGITFFARLQSSESSSSASIEPCNRNAAEFGAVSSRSSPLGHKPRRRIRERPCACRCRMAAADPSKHGVNTQSTLPRSPNPSMTTSGRVLPNSTLGASVPLGQQMMVPSHTCMAALDSIRFSKSLEKRVCCSTV